MHHIYQLDLKILMSRQNGRCFPDGIFKCIFMNENALISIHTQLEFVPMGEINIIPALVQIMARRRTGAKQTTVNMGLKFSYPPLRIRFQQHCTLHCTRMTDIYAYCVCIFHQLLWSHGKWCNYSCPLIQIRCNMSLCRGCTNEICNTWQTNGSFI